MKEAAHLIRLGVLFAAGTILFLLVRQAVVPAGFGKYGHYRAGALDDNRARPVVYAGRAACAPCHEEALTALRQGKHAEVGCEACHGPQSAHANDPGNVKPVLPKTETLCAHCHEAGSAKPRWFPQVVSQEHSGGAPCGACHKPHTPKVQ